MKLKDKSAIVTGAASGIGKEIAFTFAREGANVVIADLNKAASDAAAAEISARGGHAIGVAMDVCNEEAVNTGVAAAVATFGGATSLSAMPVSKSCIHLTSLRSPTGRECWLSTWTAPS
jgi:3-hydroxybutyrate dehydrogenase